jgi:hypothetical protein
MSSLLSVVSWISSPPPQVRAPGWHRAVLAEAGELVKSRELPPPDESPPDPDRIAAIGARHGMQIQPPSQEERPESALRRHTR